MKRILVFVLAGTLFAGISYAQTATPQATKRQIHQQDRIKQGVKSGELTKGEATKLEVQQHKIAKDKVKAKSDGVVTPQERAKLHREQERASKNIHRKKHNEIERH